MSEIFRPYPPMRRIAFAEFEKLFEQFVGTMREIGLGKKANDYGDPENCLCCFGSSGWRGIIMTCSQKFGRLIQMAWGKQMAIKEESFKDNVTDIAFYMFLALCCWEAEKTRPSVCQNCLGIGCLQCAASAKLENN